MQLRTLGGLALEGSNLTRQRPLLLLAFVALQGGATRRELADLFFIHAADPRDSLSAAVGQVRRAAGDMLVLDDNTVTTTVPCDAVMLLNDFDDYRFESVIRAYRGPFCAGYDQTMGEELEEWLFSMREQLALRTRSALLHRSRAAAADGRLDEARRAVTEALALVGAPELIESDVADLLPLLRALESPEIVVLEELAGEFGVEDSVTVADRLPRRDVTSVGRRSMSAPFVGRHAEMTALAALLVSPDERIITVQGLGGIGKSRLVDKVAELATEQLSEVFPDGVHRVYLDAVTAAGDVEPVIAARLGFAPERVKAAGGLAVLLRNWSALVVIDNLEHRVDAAGLLADIATVCKGVKLLVTSRVRLGLAGERTFALGGLSVSVAPGATSDAAQLFIDRAGRVGLTNDLNATELAEVEGLCVDLEGYPLGIELAAGMLRVLPLARLRGEVARSLDVLAHGPSDAPERHRAVRAAFEPSWRRLTRRERDASLRLSVFRGGCDFDAAKAVGRVELSTLTGLVDQAFLRHDIRVGRFSFHPLVREFVAAKRPDALIEEASLAHRDYVAGVLKRAAVVYRTHPHVALDGVTADIANVLSAVEWALGTGETAVAVEMLMLLVVDCDYLEARGGSVEIAELIERVAEAAVTVGNVGSANRLLARAGDAYRLYTTRMHDALRLYRRALALAEMEEETGRRIILNGQIGALVVFTDPELAKKHIQIALELAHVLGDELMLCEALNRSAYIAHALGATEEMLLTNLRLVDIATRLMQDTADGQRLPRIESSLYFALHNLGVAEDDLGLLEESLQHRLRALRFAEERGHRLWAGYAHEELTFLLLQMGADTEAREHAVAARASFHRVGAELSLIRLAERLLAEDPAGLLADVRE